LRETLQRVQIHWSVLEISSSSNFPTLSEVVSELFFSFHSRSQWFGKMRQWSQRPAFRRSLSLDVGG
jgi:hypothetical protein